MKKLAKHQVIIITVFIFGCYNAPTPPSEIEGAHISGLHYEKYDCESLVDEIKFLKSALVFLLHLIYHWQINKKLYQKLKIFTKNDVTKYIRVH